MRNDKFPIASLILTLVSLLTFHLYINRDEILYHKNPSYPLLEEMPLIQSPLNNQIIGRIFFIEGFSKKGVPLNFQLRDYKDGHLIHKGEILDFESVGNDRKRFKLSVEVLDDSKIENKSILELTINEGSAKFKIMTLLYSVDETI